MKINRLLACGVFALTLCTGAALAVDNPDVLRQGAGERRAQLDAMELKPFASDNWSLLSEAKLDAAALKGKPVLIVNWTAWTPTGQQALNRAAALGEKFADKGLTVIAVHSDAKFDSATKFIADKGVKNVTLAKDVGNKFRTAIKSEGDPSLFVIDRAGNMRFAQVQSGSLEAALELVAGETSEQAAARPQVVKEEERLSKERSGRAKDINDDIQAGQKLGLKAPVSFKTPSAEEYEKTLWPMKNDPEKGGSQLNANDLQGNRFEYDLNKLEALTDKPSAADYKGRIVIIDFWATWCVPCKRSTPLIEDIARVNRDDVLVVAVSGVNDPKPDVVRYLREHKVEYAHLYDREAKGLIKPVGVNGIPHVIVISTDGIVRWQGNPLDKSFRKVVDQIIANDPGARNRRDAEKQAREKLGLQSKGA